MRNVAVVVSTVLCLFFLPLLSNSTTLAYRSRPLSSPSNISSSNYEPFFNFISVLEQCACHYGDAFLTDFNATHDLESTAPFLTIKAFISRSILAVQQMLKVIFVPKYFEAVKVFPCYSSTDKNLPLFKPMEELFHDPFDTESKLFDNDSSRGGGVYLQPGQKFVFYTGINGSPGYLSIPKDCKSRAVLIDSISIVMHSTNNNSPINFSSYFVLLNSSRIYNLTSPNIIISDIFNTLYTKFGLTRAHIDYIEAEIYRFDCSRYAMRLLKDKIFQAGPMMKYFLEQTLKHIFCKIAYKLQAIMLNGYQSIQEHLNNISASKIYSKVCNLIEKEIAPLATALGAKSYSEGLPRLSFCCRSNKAKKLAKFRGLLPGLPIGNRFIDHLKPFTLLLPFAPMTISYSLNRKESYHDSLGQRVTRVPWLLRPFIHTNNEHPAYSFILWRREEKLLCRQSLEEKENLVDILSCKLSLSIPSLVKLQKFNNSYKEEYLDESQALQVFGMFVKLFSMNCK